MTLSDTTESVSAQSAGSTELRSFAPGAELCGRYELKDVLGAGGFAVVYRAYDRSLKREVALKVLRRDRSDAVSLRRFRKEVAVARDVESPRLVRVHDLTEAGEAVFLTMEYVAGESLKARLARGPVPLDEAVRLADEVAEALEVLHAAGLVHRDVKPGNILLTRDGHAKLADFGLVREVDADESRTGQGVVGTPSYLSPEQALGRKADARSDLYALGVVLHEMLAGVLPRDAGAPGDLRARLPESPPWLNNVVQKLLAPDAACRFPTAGAVRTALRERRAGRPRLVRWLGAAAAVVVGGMLGASLLRDRGEVELVFNPDGHMRVVDQRGRGLWEHPLAYASRTTLARLSRDEPRRVVSVLSRPADLEGRVVNRLSVLEPFSGALLEEVELPRSYEFDSFSRRYAPYVTALDVNRDGVDELLVTYTHSPSWPSYTVLYEPALGRKRVTLSASGHHFPLGAADLDGDGAPELILAGASNRMGWYLGVAAVRLSPPVGSARDEAVFLRATTPDLGTDELLLWYKLMPLVEVGRGRSSLHVDEGRRRLRILARDGAVVELGFDGFRDAVSRPEALERQAARARSYAELRRAEAFLASGDAGSALQSLELATGEAMRSGDVELQQWCRRREAIALVAAGRSEQAERLAEELRPSVARGDLEIELGSAFHRSGEVARASSWFGHGLARTPEQRARPRRQTLLEGLFFALVELHAWPELLDELSRTPVTARRDTLQSYARWRSGVPVSAPVIVEEPGPSTLDIVSYWRLETELATRPGGTPEPLGASRALRPPTPPELAAVDRALDETTEIAPLLLSVRAEILAGLGRLPEALTAARQSFEMASLALSRDVVIRAHFDVVVERYRRLARMASAERDARQAGSALERHEALRTRELARYRAGRSALARKGS